MGRLIKKIVNSNYTSEEIHYDHLGRILFQHSHVGDGRNIWENFIYNDNKLIRVEFEESYRNKDEKFRSEYQYIGDSDYRVLTYKTHERGLDELSSDAYILHGKDCWKQVDLLISIKEYKYENSKLIYESSYNLETEMKYKYQYKFLGKNKIWEKIEDGFNGNSETIWRYQNGEVIYKRVQNESEIVEITYEYSNGYLSFSNAVTTDFNGDIITNKKERYHNDYDDNGNLIKAETFLFDDEDKAYLAFQKLYWYDKQNNCIKEEYYGRFNSKMYLYYRLEVFKSDNVEERVKCYQDGIEEYLGYFDYKSMLENMNRTQIDENMFDRKNYLMKEKHRFEYDYHGNLEKYILYYIDSNQIFREIYHNEYNKTNDLEYSIKFKQDEAADAQFDFIEKYYYAD
jgi:hypothetical protein